MDEQELKAVVEARKELGPEHEEHLVAGFVDKLEQEIDRRVDAEARDATPPRREQPAPREPRDLHPDHRDRRRDRWLTRSIAAFVALGIVFLVSELRR